MFKASLAVDGNKSTCMRTLEIGLNSQFKRVWWKVDLGGVYNIYSVGILFRNYDGQGMCFCIQNTIDIEKKNYIKKKTRLFILMERKRHSLIAHMLC